MKFRWATRDCCSKAVPKLPRVRKTRRKITTCMQSTSFLTASFLKTTCVPRLVSLGFFVQFQNSTKAIVPVPAHTRVSRSTYVKQLVLQSTYFTTQWTGHALLYTSQAMPLLRIAAVQRHAPFSASPFRNFQKMSMVTTPSTQHLTKLTNWNP